MSLDTTQQRPVAIAPAVHAKVESNEEHMSFACVQCTRRKVKCDKLAPICSTCRKAKLDCEYQEPAPRKRKRKPPADYDIQERLEHYEALLKQHGISPAMRASAPNTSHSSPSTNSQNTPYVGEIASGKLVTDQGKTRYITSNLWSNLGDHDFHPSSDEEDNDDGPNDPMSALQSPPNTDPLSGAILGASSPSANLLSFHPTYDHAMKLWNIYSEKIDPILKIVHVPSGLVMLQRAAANPSAVSKTSEALLFAIYHFAVTVISETEALALFGMPKASLVATYHSAVRQALVNTSFLRTTDLTLLQAYMVFLISVRTTYDPHTFWILTGVAVRISQRMGLHRDGEELGLPPFETEMRRRVFWQLLPLDGMASQFSGTGMNMFVQTDLWTTKQPGNINDTDFWPDMTETPTSQVGATDIIFVRARTEMVKFIMGTNPPLPIFGPTTQVWDFKNLSHWEAQLDELENVMETKYLRYCDFSNPLHNVVAAMARTAANSGRMRLRLTKLKVAGEIPAKEKEELWTLSKKMIDYDIASQQNLNVAKFYWHLEAFFMWDPFIWILNEIQRDPLNPTHRGLWDRIEKVYNNHPKMLTQRRALHIAVGQLTLRAWDAVQSSQSPEQQALQSQTGEPAFIISLRAFTSKRRNSRGSSTVPLVHEYNAFDPQQNTPIEDIGTFNFPSNNVWNSNMSAFTTISSVGDFRADSMDWGFWDQLVRDPNAFPTTA